MTTRGGRSDPGSPDRRDESQLVRAAKAGSEEAFDHLVERYLDAAHAVALGILKHHQDAEDAVQDAFIRALERIDQLEPGSDFGPWFYRVVRNVSLNLLRHEKLRDHGPVPEGASGGPDPERETYRKMTRQRVLDALEQLPEMQRSAVMLYDIEGYTHREIAEILEVAPGTSRAHLHHGRKTLRSLLSAPAVPTAATESRGR